MNNPERTLITNKESGLLFDYFFGRIERDQINHGSVLIASNPKAAEIYSCIKQTLAQLEHMRDEGCPDELVNMTIARLKLATVIKPLPHINTPQ